MVGKGGRAVKYFFWLLDKSDNINEVEKATYETVLWKGDGFISYLIEIEKMVSFLGC